MINKVIVNEDSHKKEKVKFIEGDVDSTDSYGKYDARILKNFIYKTPLHKQAANEKDQGIK